jgi:hypothetical protein
MKNARVRVTCSVFPEGFGIIFWGLLIKLALEKDFKFQN